MLDWLSRQVNEPSFRVSTLLVSSRPGVLLEPGHPRSAIPQALLGLFERIELCPLPEPDALIFIDQLYQLVVGSPVSSSALSIGHPTASAQAELGRHIVRSFGGELSPLILLLAFSGCISHSGGFVQNPLSARPLTSPFSKYRLFAHITRDSIVSKLIEHLTLVQPHRRGSFSDRDYTPLLNATEDLLCCYAMSLRLHPHVESSPLQILEEMFGPAASAVEEKMNALRDGLRMKLRSTPVLPNTATFLHDWLDALELIDKDMAFSIFSGAGMTNPDSVPPEISLTDLKALGVVNTSDAIKLWNAIQSLKSGNDGFSPVVDYFLQGPPDHVRRSVLRTFRSSNHILRLLFASSDLMSLLGSEVTTNRLYPPKNLHFLLCLRRFSVSYALLSHYSDFWLPLSNL